MAGDEPKTAFAGWFRSGTANFYENVRRPSDERLF